jgi:hypothetical protein
LTGLSPGAGAAVLNEVGFSSAALSADSTTAEIASSNRLMVVTASPSVRGCHQRRLQVWCFGNVVHSRFFRGRLRSFDPSQHTLFWEVMLAPTAVFLDNSVHSFPDSLCQRLDTRPCPQEWQDVNHMDAVGMALGNRVTDIGTALGPRTLVPLTASATRNR